MKPRVCVCCGESMSERGGSLSRNPNVCASCSSLVDGAPEGEGKRTCEELPPPVASVGSFQSEAIRATQRQVIG